jgi:succinate dehydrogenase / fumarate reductase cytochrome b subunit
MAHPLAKLVTLGLVWAYLHHLLAGIRHLALDLHIGADLKVARQSSTVVFVVALALTGILGARLW